LSKENDVEVELIKGKFLELSVSIDDEKVIETNPLWYPLPSGVISRTRELLAKAEVAAKSAREP
jgi:hypothetical protein